MAGPIRDDSAGSYGTWNNDELSWLDYLTAKASDGGNALYNLGANVASGFSPVGVNTYGQPQLQVPPIAQGIGDSVGRLVGTPNNPGNAWNLTGVAEFDEPIQQDMMNGLLPFYGGQAVGGLARAMRGAPVAKALSDTGKPSILGSAMAGAGERNPIDIRRVDEGKNRGVYHALVGDDVAGYADYGVLPNAGVVRGVAVDPAFQRQGVASALHGRIQDDLGLPLTPDNTLSQEGYDFWKASYPEAVRDHRPNGTGYWIDDVNRDMSKGVPAWRMSGGPNRPDDVLWSDNRPSLLGSALATAGENYDLPEWLRF